MGFDNPDFYDVGDDSPLSSSKATCSICLDLVLFGDQRTCVKLICGHEFHLDCIGSAFNNKGLMQCPNCRNTERGQWLYASHPVLDDYFDEDFYDLTYSTVSFGDRWCPFLLSHISSYGDAEFLSRAYGDLLGHQNLYAEYASAYSSSLNTGSSLSEIFDDHWSGRLASEIMSDPYNMPSIDTNFEILGHRAVRTSPQSAGGNRSGTAEQSSVPSLTRRAARITSDTARSPYPFLSFHRRASNNIPSSMVPPYPRTAARTQPPTSSTASAIWSAVQLPSSNRNSYSLTPPASHNPNLREVESEAARELRLEERYHSLFDPVTLVGLHGGPGWGIFSNTTFEEQRHGSDRTPSTHGQA